MPVAYSRFVSGCSVRPGDDHRPNDAASVVSGPDRILQLSRCRLLHPHFGSRTACTCEGSRFASCVNAMLLPPTHESNGNSDFSGSRLRARHSTDRDPIQPFPDMHEDTRVALSGIERLMIGQCNG